MTLVFGRHLGLWLTFFKIFLKFYRPNSKLIDNQIDVVSFRLCTHLQYFSQISPMRAAAFCHCLSWFIIWYSPLIRVYGWRRNPSAVSQLWVVVVTVFSLWSVVISVEWEPVVVNPAGRVRSPPLRRWGSAARQRWPGCRSAIRPTRRRVTTPSRSQTVWRPTPEPSTSPDKVKKELTLLSQINVSNQCLYSVLFY